MDIGRRIRDVREDLGMPAAELARRVGVAPNTVWRYESGEREPSMAMLEKIARALRTQPAELLREPSPSAEALSDLSRTLRERDRAIMESVREVSVEVEDVQSTLLEAEHLRETALPRVEEALASIADAQDSLAEDVASHREQMVEASANLADAQANLAEDEVSHREQMVEASASLAEAEASYREQVAHLQDVRIVMDQVYGSELKLGRAYVKAMMEEGSAEGPQARRLRSASRKMVLFYEELVGLIKDAGVHVKREDEGEAVEEPEASARTEALVLTVH
jgi:transcriptional regulator with XRE-family HTH domain